MLSLRQLEALVWIAQLGTFERAASRLSTSQSTISKRIIELEDSVGFAVFDRSQRGARLTPQGEEVLQIARQMLALQDEIAAIKVGGATRVARRLRIGITEATAMTWLPRLIFALRESHPGITIEPEVGHSLTLYEGLQSGQLDIIVCPDFVKDANVHVLPLATLEFSWVAKPGFTGQTGPLTLDRLVSLPLLMQGGRSGAGNYLYRWLMAERLMFEKVLVTDSLMATVGMTVAGMGICHLPLATFRHLIESGRLEVIQTDPHLPQIPYVAMFRNDHSSHLMTSIARVMQETCDFSEVL